MWRRECFVQVDVHDIHTEITRADFANECVKVCAVAIEVTTRIMQQF